MTSGLRPPTRVRSIAARKAKSAVFDGLLWAAGVVAVVPLFLLITYVLAKGVPAAGRARMLA